MKEIVRPSRIRVVVKGMSKRWLGRLESRGCQGKVNEVVRASTIKSLARKVKEVARSSRIVIVKERSKRS